MPLSKPLIGSTVHSLFLTRIASALRPARNRRGGLAHEHALQERLLQEPPNDCQLLEGMPKSIAILTMCEIACALILRPHTSHSSLSRIRAYNC